MAAILIFSLATVFFPQGVFMSILMLVSGFERFPRENPLIAAPLCVVGIRVYLPCSGYYTLQV